MTWKKALGRVTCITIATRTVTAGASGGLAVVGLTPAERQQPETQCDPHDHRGVRVGWFVRGLSPFVLHCSFTVSVGVEEVKRSLGTTTANATPALSPAI